MDCIKENFNYPDRYLLGILCVSFLLRIWGISYGMPYAFILDETYLVNRSLAFGTGDFNPHLFEWPGHLLMYALFAIYGVYFVVGYVVGIFSSAEDFALSFMSDPSYFYIIGRVFIVLLSTTTVYVTYLVGTWAYDRKTGLIAAIFLAVSPLVSGVAHFILTDNLVLLASIGLFIPALRIISTGLAKDYFWGGLIIGLGMAIKYNAGALIIPLGVAHMLHIVQNRKPILSIYVHKRFFIAGLSLLSGFLMGCPYCLLDYPSFIRDLVFQFSRVSEVGMINAEYASPFLYYLQEALAGGIGLGITIVCLFGIAHSLYQRRSVDILFLIYIAIYFLYVSSWKVAIDKYLLPIIPSIIIIGASMISRISDKLPVHQKINSYIMISAIFILGAEPLVKSLQVDYTLTQKDTRSIAKEWIEATISEGTKIAIDSGRLNIAKLSPPLNDTPNNLYKIFVERGMISDNKYLKSVGNISNKYYDLLTRSNSGKKYPLTRIVLSSDGRVDRSLSVEELIKNNVEYVVVSSFAYEGYVSPSYRQNHPEAADYYTRFYRELDETYNLIKEFRSDPNRRQGPTIKIYRIPASESGKAMISEVYNEK
ncbi:MAG: hypothetical protein AMK70_00560 [Nitrospira bacterium SG8_35_1]|nr:MAG: hypothetical protein AMK70_00560 [Nitrospira bacterium SG8_35_1]